MDSFSSLQFMGMVAGSFLLVAFVVWGNWPGRKKPQSQTADDSGERDRQIGILVGSAGGDIQDAAVMRYALDRLEGQTGQAASVHEQGVALGATLETSQE
jgi:hypothetical protein